MNIWLLALVIMTIAVFMVMTGHGGGNFFIITLVFAGVDMHVAACSVQFILFSAAFFAMIVFGRKKVVEWKVAILFGLLILISSFSGGYFSDYLPGKSLKLILSVLLFILAIFMIIPSKMSSDKRIKRGWRNWNVRSIDKEHVYSLNLLLIVPVVLVFGFISGMVGISGGSFLVPLMVLAGRVPIKNAVGTVSVLVSVSALSGFTGHALNGHFDYRVALPLAIGASVGGIIGGSIALKTKPVILKILFAGTTLAAAIILAAHVL
ncbi:MAG: sulfite exporter TauE/SafE family protein [Bacteroidales bacterium]|nr:sulfite exporter TauE/SafE family protein [Bacteroidales bacterium]MCF8398464.1 sulfite exporter TauE/SafE family protein [Bacteroidales bacterium]